MSRLSDGMSLEEKNRNANFDDDALDASSWGLEHAELSPDPGPTCRQL